MTKAREYFARKMYYPPERMCRTMYLLYTPAELTNEAYITMLSGTLDAKARTLHSDEL